GYHEPIVDVADTPGTEYSVPIHAVPRDLGASPGPYWTRAEIEQGRMGSQARPIAWARDPVDVFFMEIEGSGTLHFPDGREVRITRPVEIPGGLIGWKSVGRFVLTQDAGGAIRGPGRVDIFWGRGPEAELAASDMKQPGELYFVVPRLDGALASRGRRPRCCE